MTAGAWFVVGLSIASNAVIVITFMVLISRRNRW